MASLPPKRRKDTETEAASLPVEAEHGEPLSEVGHD